VTERPVTTQLNYLNYNLLHTGAEQIERRHAVIKNNWIRYKIYSTSNKMSMNPTAKVERGGVLTLCGSGCAKGQSIVGKLSQL